MVHSSAYYFGPTIIYIQCFHGLSQHIVNMYHTVTVMATDNVISPHELKHLHTVYQVGVYIGPYAPGGATHHISLLVSVIPDNDIFI